MIEEPAAAMADSDLAAEAAAADAAEPVEDAEAPEVQADSDKATETATAEGHEEL